MDRPQIYFFLLPLTIITLVLYFKMLFILWEKRATYNTLFYKLVRTQSVFDVSYIIAFFAFEIPQDWAVLYNFLCRLNDTFVVQLFYAHSYTCVIGQILGVTLNSIGRVISVRFSTWQFAENIEKLSHATVMLIHWTPPIFFGLFIFYGQTPSHFEFVDSLNRIARVTEVEYVQINSIVSMATSVTGALVSLMCYVLIFISLRKKPYRCWNTEASILCSSFVLFLSLCAVAAYYLNNGLLSIVSTEAMFTLRKHNYAFSFPISLLNPWCLLLTSAKIRQDVLGKSLSQTRVIQFLPSEITPPKTATNAPRTTSTTRSTFTC